MPDDSRAPNTAPPHLRVLLVDDNRLMLEGLANLLEAHSLQVAGMAKDGLEAVTMAQAGKPLVWIRGEVKSPPFSPEARVQAGFLLRRLQQGETLGLPHSRPMPTIGPGTSG